jgi:hypothetical protein
METEANLGPGIVPWWDAPRILVFADDAERARRILLELEERQRARTAEASAGPPIEVVCEKCGERSAYPAAQQGSVQNCPNCGAYVDVEEVEA